MNSKSWKLIRRITVMLVAVAVAWTLWRGIGDLRQQPLDWGEFRWGWLWAAVGLTFLGTVPGWLFWHQLLRQFGLPVTLMESFRAFYLSQLGKYFPGKLLVIAIRAAILHGRAVRQPAQTGPPAPPIWLLSSMAAVAETLTFIAVGAAWGVACGAWFLADRPWVLWLGIAVSSSFLISLSPPVLRRWLPWVPGMRAKAERQWLIQRWTWRLLLTGIGTFSLAWLTLATGLLALTQVLPQQPGAWDDLPRLTASVTLPNVLGFVSLIPGGLGVREVVMFPLLVPRFPAALLLVVLHRLATMLAECLAAGLAYGIGWFRHRRHPTVSIDPSVAARQSELPPAGSAGSTTR